MVIIVDLMILLSALGISILLILCVQRILNLTTLTFGLDHNLEDINWRELHVLEVTDESTDMLR